jgi:hypothetical protein
MRALVFVAVAGSWSTGSHRPRWRGQSDCGAIAELFQQVYANPDDDHVRQVLSDALVLIGDPRGELIQLQLQPSADLERRAMQLIQRHGLTWLGGLRGAVVPLAYERGFLASCMLTTITRAAREERHRAHDRAVRDALARVRLHPVMRAAPSRRRVAEPALTSRRASRGWSSRRRCPLPPLFDDARRYLPAS